METCAWLKRAKEKEKVWMDEIKEKNMNLKFKFGFDSPGGYVRSWYVLPSFLIEKVKKIVFKN